MADNDAVTIRDLLTLPDEVAPQNQEQTCLSIQTTY